MVQHKPGNRVVLLLYWFVVVNFENLDQIVEERFAIHQQRSVVAGNDGWLFAVGKFAHLPYNVDELHLLASHALPIPYPYWLSIQSN